MITTITIILCWLVVSIPVALMIGQFIHVGTGGDHRPGRPWRTR